jgi:hypothetical protein
MSKGVIEGVAGAAILAAGIALDAVTAGAATPFEIALMTSGAGMLLSGLGTLIGQQSRGVAEMSRNPIQPWNVIYGRTKVGGTTIYQEEVADNNRILLMADVLACHPCQEIEQLWFNNKQVIGRPTGPFSDSSNPSGFMQSYGITQAVLDITSISRQNNVVYVTFASNPVGVLGDFDGQTIWIRNTTDPAGGDTFNGFWPVAQTGPNSFTYICGGIQGAGQATGDNGYGSIKTTWPNYEGRVVWGNYLGNQTEASGIIIGNTAGYWTSNCLVSGMTYAALKLTYDDGVFNGLPSISFVVQGKNNIYDPRTGTYGYTTNAALCIADYLSNPTWGFGARYGIEIPTAPLIAAANVCDEQVPLASGAAEARYTCNGTFDVSTKRGEVLQNLLTSCAGRLSYSGGQFVIQPGAWYGPTSTISLSGLTAPSTVPPMMMSTEGLVANAYNNVEGRQDYFPSTGGTSESQFLMALGMLDAYDAVGNTTALSIAKLALKPVLPVLYRNYPIPETVTNTAIFAPHWLFNVKAPFVSSVVRYEDTFIFTNGVATIPDTFGSVRYVFQVLSPGYTLVYQSPYSPPSAGTAYPVASYAYSSTANGTVVTLENTSFSGTLGVIYSCISGPIISPGEDFEAYPDWRPLAQGEIDSACDSYNWAYRMFNAASVTGDATWAACASATAQQAAVAYTINNQRQWIAPSIQLQPLSQSGAFFVSSGPVAPVLQCDTSGAIQIVFQDNGAPLSGYQAQFGVAGIGNILQSTDTITFDYEISGGPPLGAVGFGETSSVYIQFFVDTTNQQPFNEANRYCTAPFADSITPGVPTPGFIPGTSGSSGSITLTAAELFQVSASYYGEYYECFSNPSYPNGIPFPAGTSVYTAGVAVSGYAGMTITIKSVTVTPNITVQYEGGVIPFTANFLGNPASLIGWQGPVYAGYQSPWMFKQLGNEINVATNIQFLADAQSAWTTQATPHDVGPFAPVFYFNKPDAIQYGPANTFGWAGPDPNTEWGGYAYRPLAELAELINTCTGSESYYSQAVTIANNFLSWIDANWPSATVTAGVPSIFPQSGASITYPEPHFVALIIRAALAMDEHLRPNGNSSGAMNATYASLLSKAMTFWAYWYQTSGVMQGTFSPSPSTQEWFGFWHGEILRTLSTLYTWASSPNIGNTADATQAKTWINGMVGYVSNNIVAVNSDLGYTASDLSGSIRWMPKLAKRDLFNGIKGTFICESNQFQISDFPYYAQDNYHGYTNGAPQYEGDLNWQTDGARLWKDVQLPFTSSSSMAQRIAKIELMRIRQQGRGTLQGRMSMYQSVPLDIVYMSMPALGWSNEILEVGLTRFNMNAQNGKAPRLNVELDVQQTDPSVYDWSVTEELTVQGYPQIATAYVAAPAPQNTAQLDVDYALLADTSTPYTISVNGVVYTASNPNLGVSY